MVFQCHKPTSGGTKLSPIEEVGAYQSCDQLRTLKSETLRNDAACAYRCAKRVVASGLNSAITSNAA